MVRQNPTELKFEDTNIKSNNIYNQQFKLLNYELYSEAPHFFNRVSQPVRRDHAGQV